ncbi:3722_t:CDS:2 [Dentiscutata erythropus]|uniref:3722_t:CDS:1 n=1 Tax=Dentiscutata erythropus TaxID=1348616 RepID=A0A9N9ATH7_9GLOM|nr:3722_t:CDS:2 [Dentiscutata erythropus]
MAQDSTDIRETIGALDDYVLLGRSGLRISPLCLGALTFGEKFVRFSLHVCSINMKVMCANISFCFIH